MVISLTPQQFEDLKKVIEFARRSMIEAPAGELTILHNAFEKQMEWDAEEVKITISD